MNQYLLDTNICAFLLRGKYSIDKKVREVGIENCHISEITYAELLFGVERSANKQKNSKILEALIENIDIIPISSVIPFYAITKNHLWNMGRPVDDFDLFIGTTSVVEKMVMVTENTKHFENIPNIMLENWVER